MQVERIGGKLLVSPKGPRRVGSNGGHCSERH